MTAYYNEIDGHAAQWLRNLIEDGHIAPGYVDERSIEDVFPSDLRGFTQCHFFAGIGVWSYALRQAGWSDDRPVWTGSCPCQPFSAAGKGAGFDDERHLWPAFHHLISQCKPAIVLGEQVASKDADTWIDLVHTDMEALGYAFGAIPFPSAGIGAPHIRDRLYWVADTERQQHKERIPRPGQGDCTQRGREAIEFAGFCMPSGLADTASARLEEQVLLSRHGAIELQEGVLPERWAIQDTRSTGMPSPNNGLWANADWLGCRDGKWRPVEPGTFPLAHGTASRVVRLRAYGNAINAKAAQAFIECLT